MSIRQYQHLIILFIILRVGAGVGAGGGHERDRAAYIPRLEEAARLGVVQPLFEEEVACEGVECAESGAARAREGRDDCGGEVSEGGKGEGE